MQTLGREKKEQNQDEGQNLFLEFLVQKRLRKKSNLLMLKTTSCEENKQHNSMLAF